MTLTLRELETKGVRHAGAAPARSVWKTDMLAVTSMPRNWPLEWVSRPPLRIFNPPLICLSHPALDKMVPLRGDAPRSLAYRASALLLSYRGMKLAEHQRIALWTPLGAQRFSGPFPRLCRTCSVEMAPAPGLAPGTTAVRSGVCNAVTPCGF